MKKALSELQQSEQILEIRRVNPVFVSRYRQAMRQGDEFPPLVITKDNVIVSGNHRFEAYTEEYPEDHKVPVEVRKYDNEAEMIADAVKDNARHGNPLDGISRKRAILRLLELGKDEDAISKLFGVSVKHITKMAGEYVVVRGNGKRPVKRGLEHLTGKTVSKKQYKAHDQKDRAMKVYSQCEQINRWLENGWVDFEDKRNTKALTDLASTIDEKLGILA